MSGMANTVMTQYIALQSSTAVISSFRRIENSDVTLHTAAIRNSGRVTLASRATISSHTDTDSLDRTSFVDTPQHSANRSRSEKYATPFNTPNVFVLDD